MNNCESSNKIKLPDMPIHKVEYGPTASEAFAIVIVLVVSRLYSMAIVNAA